MARRVRQTYETFLLSNASQITALESSLRSITYLLPGRFKDSELTKSTSAVARRVRDDLAGDLPKLSLHARYTNHWRTSASTYKRAASLLMMIEATQLLIEMVARRKMQERAWDVVVAIETVKAVLRFTLVQTSQNRPVIEPALPQRELDPAVLERRRGMECMTWRGARTGVVHRSITSLVPSSHAPHSRESDVYEYLLSHTLTEQDVAPAANLVRPLQATVGRVAESLWIARPLLYVLALRRWGKRDVKPFVFSLVLEILARSLRQRSFYLPAKDAAKLPVPPMSSVSLMLSMLGIENSFLDWLAGSLSRNDPRSALAKPISTVEGDEWSARDRSFWWYLLRGPVWYHYTRPKIAGFVRRTEGKRLVGMLGSIARDYLPLVDDYYYYTAL